MLMLNWWVFYRWHNAPEWTFFLFVWVTLAPTLMYLASSVIAPVSWRKPGPPVGATTFNPTGAASSSSLRRSGRWTSSTLAQGQTTLH